jgi:hypothetical protein
MDASKLQPASTRRGRRNIVVCPIRGCGVVVRLDKFQSHISKMHPASSDSHDKLLTFALSKAQVVHSADYADCPQCGLRLLKKTLPDHIKMSCKKRGTGSAARPPWHGLSYDDHWKPW